MHDSKKKIIEGTNLDLSIIYNGCYAPENDYI